MVMHICLLKEVILTLATVAPVSPSTPQPPKSDHEVKYKVVSRKIDSKNTHTTTIIYEKAPAPLSNPLND